MSRCPNCNYELVLLEHRRKYKCAKCSKLFSHIEIETKEFSQLNKRERQKEKEEAEKQKKKDKLEYAKQYQKENPEKTKAKCKKYYEKNKKKISEKARLYRKTNPEKCAEISRRYYEKHKEQNPEKYNQSKREYWAKNKTHLQQKRKENYERQKLRILSTQALYRQNHKIEIRIKHLRDTQKALAVTRLKFGEIRVYNIEFDNLLPTLLLS